MMASIKECKEYEVTSGRTIVCKDTKKELFRIQKLDGFSPTQADAMAHYIVVDLLNGRRAGSFENYYKDYMKK